MGILATSASGEEESSRVASRHMKSSATHTSPVQWPFPDKLPAKNRKSPATQDFSAHFYLSLQKGQFLRLPIPTSPEHKRCRNSSSGIIWTEEHNSEGPPWSHFLSLLSGTKLLHIDFINPGKWSEQQGWQSSRRLSGSWCDFLGVLHRARSWSR